MVSIPLFGMKLKLGPDNDVDPLPRQVDEPNVFVPYHYHHLSDNLQQVFPEMQLSGQHIQYEVSDTQARIWIKKGLEEDSYEPDSTIEPPASGNNKSRKRERESDEEDGVECEEMKMECELVCGVVEGDQALGLAMMGNEVQRYDVLAVVALFPSSAGPDISKWQPNPYEGKTIETAWRQVDQRNLYPRHDKSSHKGIILGHIVPNRIKHYDHPLNHLHPTLLRREWIRFSHCIVTLKSPFLPSQDVVGPSSEHPMGRAVPSFATFPEEEEKNTKTLFWRDPVTKHVWNACPRRLLPAIELFGTIEFEVALSEEALEYGEIDEHDGFVTANDVPRRNLNLSSKLKLLMLDLFDSPESMIEPVSDSDDFWSRTPKRYYDNEDAVPIEFDNRLETGLEVTRPFVNSPMFEAKSSIQTPLMPFQKKALAWMYSKETDVSEDEGSILPHWIGIKRKGIKSFSDESDNRKSKKMKYFTEESSSNLFFMDLLSGTLSRRRFTSRKSEPGGCLCDSMGLGKSLTTLSLIETHKRSHKYVDQSRSAQISSKMAEELRPYVSESTLLVVPSSLVHQWYSEMRKHLGVKINENERGGYVLRYKRGITLPWTANDERQEVRRRAQDLFSGKNQATIVLATYEDLRLELQVSKRSKKAISPLLDIQWWRVMLDEAQLVSTSNGSAAEMVNCLWRTNGWIITSTPFNSSIRDMHGLLTFLDSDFASKTLFEELIAIPFSSGNLEGIQRAHSLLKRIMWRHSKEHVESELDLPPSSNQTLLVQKTGLEKSLYDREYKTILESVRNAVGLGRVLSKKQQDRLLSLRRLISHPQLASNLGYGGPGSQRTTFSNLFADLIFRNQGEVYNAQMELIVLVLKIAAGRRFQKEEKSKEMWKGGTLKIQMGRLKSLLKEAKEYAIQGVARDILHQKEVASYERAKEAGHKEVDEDSTAEKDVVEKEGEEEKEGKEKGMQAPDKEQNNDPLGRQGNTEGQEIVEQKNSSQSSHPTQPSRDTASISLRYEEALYWIENLLSDPKAATSEDATTGSIDQERLTNFFFEKKVIEASSVDLTDPRYHPIVLDAGDEEEEEEDGEREAGDKGGTSNSEAVLLKNRFRGTSNRSIKKVWYYHPRRKLQLLCNDIIPIKDKIIRLQGDANYLQNRIRQELGEERARLVLKEGFDGLKGIGSNGNGERESSDIKTKCLLCLEEIDIPGILPCLHSACFTCLVECIHKIGKGGKTPCPMCRQPFERRDIIEVLPYQSESDQVNEYGVKISGLINHIRKQLEIDSTLKIVIFSAWSTYLQYLTEALNNLSEPISSVAFSGKDQSKALEEFQTNDQIRIILVPMKMAEGAAGLTLNNASIAYLLEPSLNSALEIQALGRLNRIGQKAEKTTYYRVLVENTIEPALVEIAQRRLKAQRDKEADDRHHDSLSVEELAYVFGLDVQEEKARKKLELQSRGERNVAATGMTVGSAEQQVEEEEEEED